MARLAGRLARFSRDFEFVARRAMLVNGEKLNPGDPVDKSKFTTRRLRQLYEWRHICRVEVPVVPVTLDDILDELPTLRRKQIETQAEQLMPKRRGRPPKNRAATA